MSFGARLRALRLERELTMKELAGRSGLNTDSMTYLERRYTPPRQRPCSAWPTPSQSHRRP